MLRSISTGPQRISRYECEAQVLGGRVALDEDEGTVKADRSRAAFLGAAALPEEDEELRKSYGESFLGETNRFTNHRCGLNVGHDSSIRTPIRMA